MRREPTANVREGSHNTRDDDTDRCQSSQQARSAKCRRLRICRSFRVACQSDSPMGYDRYPIVTLLNQERAEAIRQNRLLHRLAG
jgi:hypothetical protein